MYRVWHALIYSRLHVSGTQMCPKKSSTYVNVPLRRSWAYGVCNIESCGVFWFFHLGVISARCQKLVIQAWTKVSILFEINLKSVFFLHFWAHRAKIISNLTAKIVFLLKFHLCDEKTSFFIKMCPQKSSTYVKVPLRKFHLREVNYIEFNG